MLALTIAVGLGAVLAASVAVLMLRRTPADQDEVWFLVVVRRVAGGRRLYAEVFHGAGPLPVWLALVGTRTRPPSLGRLRALGVATSVLTIVLLLTVVAVVVPVPLVVAVTAVALAGPFVAWRHENLYSALARACAISSVLLLALPAHHGLVPSPHVAAVLSGLALAGAAFAKHTVGAATAAVVLPGWLVLHGLVAAASATGALLAGSTLVLAVLARRGELRAFARRTLTDKGAYLATGRVSFAARALLLLRSRPPGWVRDVASYALVAAAVPTALLVALTRPMDAVIPGALAAASVVGVIPRADPDHVRPCAPLALVALLLALAPVPTLAVALGAALALANVVDLVRVVSRQPVLVPQVRVPGLGAVATSVPVTRQSLRAGRRIRRIAGRRVLVLRPDAAQWYVALGLHNPTAYDYPLASTFGRQGQHVVASRLRRGDVEWCLFAPMDAGPLTPAVLEDAVTTRMERVTRTAVGDLYRARAEHEPHDAGSGTPHESPERPAPASPTAQE